MTALLAVLAITLAAADDAPQAPPVAAPAVRPLSVEEAVQLGLEQAGADRVRTEGQAVARAVEKAYWNAWLAVARVEVAEAAVRLTGQIVGQQEARLEAGTGTKAQVADARQLLERFRLNLVNATSASITADRALRQVIGVAADDPVRLTLATAPTADRAGDDGAIELQKAIEAGADALMRQTDARRMDRKLSALEAATEARIAARKRALAGLDASAAPEQAAAVTPDDRAQAQARAQVEAASREYRQAIQYHLAASKSLAASQAEYERGKLGFDRYLGSVNDQTAAWSRVAEAMARERIASAELAALEGKLLERRGLTSSPARDGAVKPAGVEQPAPTPEPAPAPAPEPAPEPQASAPPATVRGQLVFSLSTGPIVQFGRIEDQPSRSVVSFGGWTLPFRVHVVQFDQPQLAGR